MEEGNILFAGEKIYGRSNKHFLRNLICKIKDIAEAGFNENHRLNPELNLDFVMNMDEPSMKFSMEYSNYGQYPNESIKKTGLKVQNDIINHLEASHALNPYFCYHISPNWHLSSCLFFDLHIEPYKGYFICPVCGEEVENCKENSVVSTLLCGKNIVMCPNKNDHMTYFVEDVINKAFQSEEYFIISESIAVHRIDLNKNQMLLGQLNVIAKTEDTSFRKLDLHVKNAELYIITDEKIPAGYIFWNDFNDKKRCLRQIFIRKEFRKGGLGTQLIEKTFEIESENTKFVIESPNEITSKILLNLGYIKEEGNMHVGVRCSFCN
ncbi:GNAT family N-acetyltransferase [Methanolobus sp. ZRKC5]|uniref:GNAT family N-acetyltransferase n=1 Tax=unclassified Methanolobus TaxID=2629569 RepID=UPI00313CFD55